MTRNGYISVATYINKSSAHVNLNYTPRLKLVVHITSFAW